MGGENRQAAELQLKGEKEQRRESSYHFMSGFVKCVAFVVRAYAEQINRRDFLNAN